MNPDLCMWISFCPSHCRFSSKATRTKPLQWRSWRSGTLLTQDSRSTFVQRSSSCKRPTLTSLLGTPSNTERSILKTIYWRVHVGQYFITSEPKGPGVNYQSFLCGVCRFFYINKGFLPHASQVYWKQFALYYKCKLNVSRSVCMFTCDAP